MSISGIGFNPFGAGTRADGPAQGKPRAEDIGFPDFRGFGETAATNPATIPEAGAEAAAARPLASDGIASSHDPRFSGMAAEAAPPRTPAQEQLLRAASDDPTNADQLAYDMSHIPSRVWYSIQPNGDLVLTSTKQPVGSGYLADFQKEASTVDGQLRGIYASEKAKGTAPLDILAKLIDFKNSQSAFYREATAWGMA